MSEIRCGEPDCNEMAATESVVQMANLTGGMMGGLFPQRRVYKCPAGHTKTKKHSRPADPMTATDNPVAMIKHRTHDLLAWLIR